MPRPPPRAPAAVCVFYDGDCGFCAALVRFARARDPRGRLRFVPLQTREARDRLAAFGLDAGRLDSVVLLQDGRVFLRSTAALRLCRHLSTPWPLLAALLCLPRSWRDRAYDFVARHRRRLGSKPRA